MGNPQSNQAPAASTQEQDPRLPRLREEFAWISDRISTQARLIAIGALTVVWAVLTGDTEAFRPNEQKLYWLSGAAVLLLVMDFLQYLFAYWQQWLQLSAVRQGLTSKGIRPLFWFRNGCFIAKIILMIATSALLLATIITTLQQKSASVGAAVSRSSTGTNAKTGTAASESSTDPKR